MTAHTTKPCRTCKRILSLGQFYRHPSTADGRLSDCKACKRAYEAEQRILKAERIREYRQEYERRPERIQAKQAWRAAWIKTPRGRESRRITQGGSVMNSAQQYRDNDTGRTRWAVLHSGTGCWYFPERYGKRAAEKLAREVYP